MNDIVINKIQSIHRCVERAREEYQRAGNSFSEDYSRQDAAVLNVLRACEQAIDLANHIIRSYKMGIPSSSAESFILLQKKFVIDLKLAEKLSNMVHFRNTIVHQYEKMDINIVESIIQNDLNDVVLFTEKIMEYINGHTS